MPITVARIHDDMMKFMMYSGGTTILHSKRNFFLKQKNNFLILVEIFVDINLVYPHDLPFQLFLRPKKLTSPGYLLVTLTGHVEGMNHEFLNKMGYKEIQQLPPIFQFNVKHILPEFVYFVDQMKEENLTYLEKKDVSLNFFKK
jgi:hypothetical protein